MVYQRAVGNRPSATAIKPARLGQNIPFLSPNIYEGEFTGRFEKQEWPVSICLSELVVQTGRGMT